VNTDPLDRPPLLGSWRNVYLLLVAVLLLEIAAMYVITRSFA
jgi:hypothetical protein